MRGTSRYPDATVYNKFRSQTHCVRYLEAPIPCVILAPNIASIRHPGHVAMKLRNFLTDEMRCALARRVFQENDSSRCRKTEWPSRLDDEFTSVFENTDSSREFARVATLLEFPCSPCELLPLLERENAAGDEVSIDPRTVRLITSICA